MPLPGVPFWTDQDIDLYHGTLDTHVASILQGIDLNKCGFLLTLLEVSTRPATANKPSAGPDKIEHTS